MGVTKVQCLGLSMYPPFDIGYELNKLKISMPLFEIVKYPMHRKQSLLF